MSGKRTNRKGGGSSHTQPLPLQPHSSGTGHSPAALFPTETNQIKSPLCSGLGGPSDVTSLSPICEMGAVITNSQCVIVGIK